MYWLTSPSPEYVFHTFVYIPQFRSAKMILSQISYLDCVAFLIFLVPQLLIHVGLFETARCGLKAMPFLRMDILYKLAPTESEADNIP